MSLLSISALLPLGVSGWWWITQPERIAREFVDSMSRAQLDEVNTLIARTSNPQAAIERNCFVEHEEYFAEWTQPGLQAKPRTLLDMIRGRQRFKMAGTEFEELVVENGGVAVESTLKTFSTLDNPTAADLQKPQRTKSYTWRDPDPDCTCTACMRKKGHGLSDGPSL